MDDDRDDDDLPPTHLAATLASVAALVVGLGVTGWLLLVSFAASFCGVMGDDCAPGEERQAPLFLVGAVATFFGVPAVVALARRDARWLYAPFVAVIVGLSTATVLVLI